MRMSVIISTLLMAVLAFFAAKYYKGRDARLTEKAIAAMESGNFEQAETLLIKVLGPAGESAQSEGTEAYRLLYECRYKSAQALLDAGNFEAAQTAFGALGEYGDSREKIKECRYRAAEALEQAGKYTEAAEAFLALSGYADALTRYDGCRFLYACELESAGQNKEAFALYRTLGSYPGAEDKAAALAMKMTGAEDAELALQLAEGYTPEEIAVIERLFTKRAALPEGALAVGFYHTVGLKKDGTVIVCGRNEEKQCDTGAWTGITAVAAGAYHTVGLKKDGTVVACGRNTEKQCDTGAWTDISAIACTDYGTVGLKKDGTVLYTGFESGTGVSGWQDIKSIGAGSYIALGVRSGGSLLSTHPSVSFGDITGLVEASPNTGYAAVLTQDGRVLTTFGDTGWSDCVAVSAGSNGFAAVTAEGKVLSYWFEARNALSFEDITGAIAVCVGGTHTAVLLKDGSVICRGSNEYGECDTAAMTLMTD